NIAISDVLFFKLLSRTAVEIRSKISLVGHDDTLGCCLEWLGERTTEQAGICFDGYTSQEMKQAYSNITTIPRKSIQIKAREIHAKGDGICVLLELLDCVDGHIPELFLETSRRENIEEIAEKGSNFGWIGKVGRLVLTGCAVEALPGLKLHQENKMEELVLDAYTPGQVTEILRMEKNSIWVGRVKVLKLKRYAMQILPKLKLHGENELKELSLNTYAPEYFGGITRTENNSIWVGKVRVLKLGWYAVGILPKLIIHDENELEELYLDSDNPKHIAGILRTENNSIWVGKVKTLRLKKHAIQILPKLGIHNENELEELSLYADNPKHITGMLKTENNSIWVGKVKTLRLKNHAIQILPKLRIHSENEMEELYLVADKAEYITEMIRIENNSVWVGKVKILKLKRHAIQIFPKLKLHGENELKEFGLSASNPGNIAEFLKTENNSIWMGKVKVLKLGSYAVQILPKL
ncbi:MAG: uncharacterized protein A8A55_3169, partial [Amphiamblys sp. WSBS2006]